MTVRSGNTVKLDLPPPASQGGQATVPDRLTQGIACINFSPKTVLPKQITTIQIVSAETVSYVLMFFFFISYRAETG